VTQAKPSKTERKRAQLARQELGERLIGLDADELRALPIDERLYDAVIDAAAMRARGALRRQKQLIGKLMRNADVDAIRLALETGGADDQLAKRLFADAEAWRDRVVAEGAPAIAALRANVNEVDGSLESLIDDLRVARNERSEKHLRRQIFRTIHAALLAQARDDRISR
jgi:ribosome-associated protein